MAPELVEEFVRAFQKEVNNRRREDHLLLEANKRQSAEVRGTLNGLIHAIAEGLRTPGLQKRLEELELRRAEAWSRRSDRRRRRPSAFIQNLAQIYRRKVEQLQHALNDPEIRHEAISGSAWPPRKRGHRSRRDRF